MLTRWGQKDPAAPVYTHHKLGGACMRVQINMITVKPGRRAAVPEHIEELSKSISEVGLLNPITVDRDYTLIAGLHRLEAAKLLGWTEIECTVSSLEGLQAELAELDENFIRSELTTVEYGELLLRRKEIYESLYPETKKGLAQAAGMNRAVGNHVGGTMHLTSKPFSVDTSEKLGVSKTTINRQIRIAKNLTPETREVIRHSGISKKTALKLTHLEPEQQIEAAKLLVAGEVKSVEEYLSAHVGIPTSESQPMKEQPPAATEEHLTQGVSKSADGDDAAAQTATPNQKAEASEGAKPENGESKAAGRKASEPKSGQQKDRKTRNKNSDAKAKKRQKKDGCVDGGQQAQAPDKDAGQQSATSQPEPPFSLGGKRFETFKESVADLKDPNKDCSCTPDSFLAEATEFVKKFYQEIEWFHNPYYEGVFLMLSQTQFDYFCQQMDSIHTAVDQLSNHVREGRIKAHEQKE